MKQDKIRRITASLRRLERDPEQRQSHAMVAVLNELAWQCVFDAPAKVRNYAGRALALAEALSDKPGIAKAKLNLAFADYYLSDYATALERAQAAAAMFRELDDEIGVGDTRAVIGLVHWGLGDFEKGLQSMLDGLMIFREVGDERRLAWHFVTIAGISVELGDLDAAWKYNNEALILFRKLKHAHGEGRALTGLGTILQRQGNSAAALEHFEKSLALFRQAGFPQSEARALSDIGTVYQSTGALQDAEHYHRQALDLRRQIGLRAPECTSLINLGRVYLRAQQIEHALPVLHQALEIAEQIGLKPKIVQIHQALTEAFEQAGDYHQALSHQKALQAAHEALFNDESNARIKKVLIGFESERVSKEAEIHRLRSIELAAALDKLKSVQSQLIQSARMVALGKLVAGVAHEVNSPIGVISSSTDVSRRAITKMLDNGDSGALQMSRVLRLLQQNNRAVLEAARRIQSTLDALKVFARFDSQTYSKVDTRACLRNLLRLLQSQFGEHICIQQKLDKVPKIEAIKEALQQALMTLLVNACEAIKEKGCVNVATATDGDRILITIADSGRGMTAEQVRDIFDIGFSQKDARVRLHVGLAHAYHVVQQHGGEIDVTSAPQYGTTFRVWLPKRRRPGGTSTQNP